MKEKTLKNTELDGAKKNVSDLVTWGFGDMFLLMSKAHSQEEGWMKSTKGVFTGNGVLVQVTTQQRNPDGSYAVAEALSFVPNVFLNENRDPETDVVVGRYISDIKVDPYDIN